MLRFEDMSGHSHWSTIKRAKEGADAQRGRVFSKMSRLITLAAREGGDLTFNPKLREIVDKAKAVNMPASNIERAIKRGTGEIAGEAMQTVIVEAYGPANTALIIEGITDNKNRALNEFRQILNQHQGKIADEGSVRWLFERKGVIFINQEETVNKEETELKAIDAGAQDLIWREQGLEVYVEPNDLEELKNKLKEKGIEIDSANLGWKAKEEIKVSDKEKESLEKLFEALDENDSVQAIYSNHQS